MPDEEEILRLASGTTIPLFPLPDVRSFTTNAPQYPATFTPVSLLPSGGAGSGPIGSASSTDLTGSIPQIISAYYPPASTSATMPGNADSRQAQYWEGYGPIGQQAQAAPVLVSGPFVQPSFTQPALPATPPTTGQGFGPAPYSAPSPQPVPLPGPYQQPWPQQPLVPLAQQPGIRQTAWTQVPVVQPLQAADAFLLGYPAPFWPGAPSSPYYPPQVSPFGLSFSPSPLGLVHYGNAFFTAAHYSAPFQSYPFSPFFGPVL
ncbi:MAG: hypothetical protein AB1847_05190 [bacterium]